MSEGPLAAYFTWASLALKSYNHDSHSMLTSRMLQKATKDLGLIRGVTKDNSPKGGSLDLLQSISNLCIPRPPGGSKK